MKSVNKNIEKSMQSWVGQTKQNLIMQLGPPSQTTSDGNSGEILAYTRRIYIPGNGYTQPIDVWEYRMFYVNTSNIIYHWLYRRNPNPPDRVDIRIL